MISRATGIPTTRLVAAERDRLLALDEELEAHVKGQVFYYYYFLYHYYFSKLENKQKTKTKNQKTKKQKEAIQIVANAVRVGRAGLNDAMRPIASFLFVGNVNLYDCVCCEHMIVFFCFF